MTTKRTTHRSSSGKKLYPVRDKEGQPKRKGHTTQVGRNAETGRLTTVEKAREKPATHVVERMPKPEHGFAKRKYVYTANFPGSRFQVLSVEPIRAGRVKPLQQGQVLVVDQPEQLTSADLDEIKLAVHALMEEQLGSPADHVAYVRKALASI